MTDLEVDLMACLGNMKGEIEKAKEGLHAIQITWAEKCGEVLGLELKLVEKDKEIERLKDFISDIESRIRNLDVEDIYQESQWDIADACAAILKGPDPC